MSKDGIETDPKKVTAISEWPVPRTVTEVWSFLGFTNYYQKFIPKYACIAKPINQLVSGENASKKRSLVEWTAECHQAFEQLKQLCSQTPILAYANYRKPFKLHTDASERDWVLFSTRDRMMAQTM